MIHLNWHMPDGTVHATAAAACPNVEEQVVRHGVTYRVSAVSRRWLLSGRLTATLNVDVHLEAA